MTQNIIIILVALCLLGFPVTPTEPRITDDAIKGAVLSFNEAGESRRDSAAIIHIRMRSAAYRGRTFAEELHMLHGDGRVRNPERASLRSDRATNPREGDQRAWLGDITRDLHEPLGWNRERGEWSTYRPRFQALFEHVQAVLDGEVPDPCGGRAIRWGGRQVDAAQIAARLEEGEVIVDCGHTQNVFLGRERVAPRRGLTGAAREMAGTP